MSGEAEAIDYDFRILVCGAYGGSYAGDMSSYLIASAAAADKFKFISMGGGTQMDCLRKVFANGDKFEPPLIDTAAQARTGLGSIGFFKKKEIKGFMISHPHLDHTAGLVIASAEDDMGKPMPPLKPVIGFESVLEGIKKQFAKPTWPINIWYDLSEAPTLVATVPKGMSAISNAHFGSSSITITAYPLSHGTELSTAFLVCTAPASPRACVLYLGDTGPDKYEDVLAVKGFIQFGTGVHRTFESGLPSKFEKLWGDYAAFKKSWIKSKLTTRHWATAKEKLVEHHKRVGIAEDEEFRPLRKVWDAVMDSIKNGELKTVFLECSYVNGRPPHLLFGHLTPELIGEELQYIAGKLGEDKASISLVVTHIKPTWPIKGSSEEARRRNAHESTQFTQNVIETQLKTEIEKAAVASSLSVTLVIPKQGDMIYAKSGEDTVRKSFRGNAMPLQLHSPHVHHYDALHGVNDYDSSRWIMAEEGVAFVALLAFVITICFILGLVCGAGYEEVKNRVTKRAKQDK